MDTAPGLSLPPAPPGLADAPVAGWSEPVVMATYEPAAAVPYPVFADARVYQGSSGRVYPLPYVERVAEVATPRRWQAVHLENRWLRVLVLPELGGRVHLTLDKTNGYDLFLRQDVVKPALVGLAGPWVAGGIELNWPQHHRPATALPVQVELEHEPDGAVTVWCSDHDPLTRMKGMHGIRLHPDRSVLELRVRLHNRTEDVQTFLWWANAAARVHEDYQAFFPTDVTHVYDHAERAVSTFPRATGPYYGVDYPARVTGEDPDADRLDWWRNVPVPTSYMCASTQEDFFGGYDHRAQAGFVHWADHRIAPGKKMWTWGNAEFGRAWERNLSEDGAAYIELMAGVFSDNQPDFSYLAPGETRAFSQWWYPLSRTGPVHQATLDAAARLDVDRRGDSRARLRVAVAVTASRPGAVVRVVEADSGEELARWTADLSPAAPLVEQADAALGPAGVPALEVWHDGALLLRWSPRPPVHGAAPATATEPPPPALVPTVEELVLTGRHLAQYRHATRAPEPYWLEALRRDPDESAALLALSAAAYRAADVDAAARHARQALRRLQLHNRNPLSGEASYRLALALRLRAESGGPAAGRARRDAVDAFWKATWDAAWRSPAQHALALDAATDGRSAAALDHVERALVGNADDLRARNLQVVLLRRLGRRAQADALLAATLQLDPLDQWARDLAGQPLTCDGGTCLDVALDHAAAGSVQDALRVLDRAEQQAAADPGGGGLLPLLGHHRALLLDRSGEEAAAASERVRVRLLPLDGCFPSRLADVVALRATLDRDPADAAAATLLATWLYDRGRREEALALWRGAADDRAGALVWRNLALAVADVERDAAQALRCMARAVELAPADSRLLWEHDQVSARACTAPEARLALLEARPDLVAARDDLTVDVAGLLCDTGEPDRARVLMQSRRFQPWEGGEGRVLAVWDRAHLLLARAALARGDAAEAQARVHAALAPPALLGEARHPLAGTAALLLALGDARGALGDDAGARRAWSAATGSAGRPRDVTVGTISEDSFDIALAWQRLGHADDVTAMAGQLRVRAGALQDEPLEVDYFATSLPGSMLLRDDAAARRERTTRLLRAQAHVLEGDLHAARTLLTSAPADSSARDLLARLPAAAGA